MPGSIGPADAPRRRDKTRNAVAHLSSGPHGVLYIVQLRARIKILIKKKKKIYIDQVAYLLHVARILLRFEKSGNISTCAPTVCLT